jgi:nucleoid-associated protein YgaU
MISKSAIYWAMGLGVAVAAAASPFAVKQLPANWGGATVAPPTPAGVASFEGQNAAGPPASIPGATTAPVAASPPAAEATKSSPTAQPDQAATDKTPPAPAGDGAQKPAFDVVRVEPTGDAVIAGRASPRASVQLRSDGQVVGQTNADDTGQFAFLPPPFSAGGHRLQLAARNEGASEVYSDAVGIDVPVTALAAAPNPPQAAMAAGPAALVAKKRIDEPARLTVTPYPLAKLKPPANAAADTRLASVGSAEAGAAAPRVSVLSVEANGDGGLEAKGVADPNAVVRLYLNNAFIAEAIAGADGRWSLTVQRGMKPGAYAIRADQINGANGLVSARAEVPFNYPDHLASPVIALTNPQPANGAPPPSKPATPQIGAAKPAPADVVANPPQVAVEIHRTEPGLQASPTKPMAQAPATPASPILTPGTNAAPSATQPSVSEPQLAKPDSAAPAIVAAQPETSQQGQADAVVAEVRTAKVAPGDNLWDLSQHFYGWGPHYRTIYEANAAQIRDPALIYPDQIFVVPQQPTD